MIETLAELSRFTVRDLILARAARAGGRLALSAHSIHGDRRRYTYGELAQLMDAMAGSLWRAGLRRGERVAFFLADDAGREFMLTSLGALALGAVVVPLNTRAADPELAASLELTSPSLLMVDAMASGRLAMLAPAIPRMAVGPSTGVDGAMEWPDPERPPTSADDVAWAASSDQLGCLLFTSGTTARPKAVMGSHRTMIAAGLCCGQALGLGEDDVYQAGFPLFTSSALNIAAMSCWVAGAGLVLEGVVGNDERLSLVAQEGTTFYHGVPSVLNFMEQAFDPGRHSFRRVRRIASGGAPMPPEVSRRMAGRWPQAEQVQIYGLTESGPSGSVLEPADIATHSGSVGRAMPYCRLEIVGDHGRSLGAGEVGEIAISGPAVAIGYFGDEPATARAFSGRRVLTGDVGWLDADGFLYFSDRKKDVINRGGLKIASVAVERVLFQHESVRETAVVAASHPDLGEDVAAFIVLKDGYAPDVLALRAHCARELADYAVPRKWRFVDALPKNPMGKVLKNELRRMADAPAS